MGSNYESCASHSGLTGKGAVWDRPDLERLYARLQDEYELKERAEALEDFAERVYQARERP